MPTSSVPPDRVVLDAGATIWFLLPTASPLVPTSLLASWLEAHADLHAPSLWLVECTSAVRRTVAAGMLTVQEGAVALENLLALDIQVDPVTPSQCRAAFQWADRLHQEAAHEGFYLALAEELDATLFTANQNLVDRLQQLGVYWVKWIGDAG